MKQHKLPDCYKCCGMCIHFRMNTSFSREKDFSGNEWGGCKYRKGYSSYMLLADKCPHFWKRLFWKYRPFKKER